MAGGVQKGDEVVAPYGRRFSIHQRMMIELFGFHERRVEDHGDLVCGVIDYAERAYRAGGNAECLK